MDTSIKLSTHFSRHEFACKCGCGFAVVDAELLYVLEALRDYFAAPISIESGTRCVKHNAAEGGASSSKHLLGIAADIKIKGVAPNAVAEWLEKTFPDCYGIGRYNTWTHIDVRSVKARWDKRSRA